MKPDKMPARRWGLRLVIFLFISVMTLGALGYGQRIELAYWAVETVAAKFGISDHRLHIEQLDYNGFTLNDVYLGPDVSLKHVRVDYSFTNLLKSRIDKVILSGVAVDVSTPDKGVLGQLQTLIKANDQGGKAEFTPPEIIINDMSIVGRQADFSLDLVVTGKVAADLSGDFQVTGKGAFQAFQIQDMDLSLGLADGAQTVLLKLRQARFLDDAKEVLLRPFFLTGDGRFQVLEQKGAFSLNLSDEKKQFVGDIALQADMATRRVQGDIQIKDITFSPGGVQPDDLSPLAKLSQKLDATFGLSAHVDWHDEEAKVTGDVVLKQARFALPPQQVREIAIAGKVGFTLFALTQKAVIETKKLSIRHQAQEALFKPVHLHAHARLENRQLSFDGTVLLDQPVDIKVLNATGTYDVQAGRGQVDIRVPVLDFTPTEVTPQDISPVFSVLNRTSGKVSGFSRLDIAGNVVSGWADLSVSKLSFETDTLQVRDITTDLLIDTIWPLRTKEKQVVTIGKIDTAVELDHPRLVFTLDGAKLHVHDFETGVIGGIARIEETVFKTDTDGLDVVLGLKKIDIGQLFELIALDGLSGSGQMSGQLPIRLKGQDINVRDGLLESVGGGTLRFQSQKARQALAGAGEQVELLLNVLNNFHYKHLSLRINQQAHQNAILNFRIEGANPDVMEARPFNLNINLEANLDRILGTMLEGYRLSDRAIRATVGDEQ
jgi:hypothetical protein